ncbi:MAG: (2Fe-2S) ferredoxin domain-containing protein [Nitrospirae bacterium]|nr:(2Fe-2S) ferredoxin domain-containing protein [Nitrospirota bacterium]
MARLKIEDLQRIKEEHKAASTLREGGFRAKITVHMGTCGLAAGARNIMSALLDEIEKSGVTDVIATTSGCAGLCSREPMATIEIINNPPVKYGSLTEDKIRRIFKEHIIGGNVIEEYALVIGSETAY